MAGIYSVRDGIIGVQSALGGRGGGGGVVATNGLLNSLLAFWPGNEASGNLLDTHSGGYTMADNATVTSTTGLVYPLARQYTAANLEYHSITNAGLTAGDVDFTIAQWVYLDTLTDAYMFSRWDGSVKQEYALTYLASSNRFRFRVSSDGLDATPILADTYGNVSTGAWNLVIGWHDAANDQIGICVNAGTPDTVSYALGVKTGSSSNAIGKNTAGTQYMNGRLGPSMMWKSAAGGGGVLTPAKRTALYNEGNGLAYTAFDAVDPT